MQQFMKQLAIRHNRLFKGDDEPTCNRIVTNDMTSNYYFTFNGVETYVDQYDLQEWFDDDEGTEEDRLSNKLYLESDLNAKAYALNELARAQYESLQA